MFWNKLARAYIVNGIVSVNATTTNSTDNDNTEDIPPPMPNPPPPQPPSNPTTTTTTPTPPEQIADLRFGCSTFAANILFHECIIPMYSEEITDYFDLARTDPEWCNQSMAFESRVEGIAEPAMRETMEKARLKGKGKAWGDGSTQGCGY